MTKKTRPPSKRPTPKRSVPVAQASATPEITFGLQMVCELLSLDSPSEFPPPPLPRPGYATFCDPGLSVLDLLSSQSPLFYPHKWYRGQLFAKRRDPWMWRQIRLIVVEPGKPFEEQSDALIEGEEPAHARVVVLLLIVLHLSNTKRPDFGRLRCADLLSSGQRVLVGPFGERGIELASCSDSYVSPSVGLSAAFTIHSQKK